MFTATKVTVLVMNALFMQTRKIYPYTTAAAQFVQLLAVNYLKFKFISRTAITGLQYFVIIVILLSTTKICSTITSENNTCYLFLTTRELSTQLCINKDINNNSNNKNINNNEVPPQSRPLEGFSSLIVL